MLLRKIIIGGAIFSMLGVASFYAAPAKKMSTVRAGQLEAEYRKAIQPRKDQIIQELTAAGFGHMAQQIIKRYEPTKQQEKQKPTQVAAAVPPTVPPAPEKQLLQQEKDLLEQRKKDLLQYNQQLQDLEREIGFISAETVSEVDAMHKKIDALQALQQTLNADASDIKKLRDILAQKKQLFLKEQEQERTEVEAKVSKAIDSVKKAESLDQIDQALYELKKERVSVTVSKLESEDQKIYQERLSKEVALLEEKKQKLLQNQTEQEKKRAEAEQQRKEQEKKRAEAEEKKKKEELELKNKKEALIQSIKETIKTANQAQSLQEVSDSRHLIGKSEYQIPNEILQENENKALAQQLQDARKRLKNIENNLIEKEVQEKIETIKNKIEKIEVVSEVLILLNEVDVLRSRIAGYEMGEARKAQLTQGLNELQKKLEQKNQLIRKRDEALAKAQRPIFSQGQTKVTIRIPDFAEDKDKSYDDVSITRDAKGNIKEIQYQDKNIALLDGGKAEQDLEKFIGAQIQADEIIKKNQYMSFMGVSKKLPNAVVTNNVNVLLTSIEQSPKVQDASTVQHRYFYNYLKPAVEARLKKLAESAQ